MLFRSRSSDGSTFLSVPATRPSVSRLALTPSTLTGSVRPSPRSVQSSTDVSPSLLPCHPPSPTPSTTLQKPSSTSATWSPSRRTTLSRAPSRSRPTPRTLAISTLSSTTRSMAHTAEERRGSTGCELRVWARGKGADDGSKGVIIGSRSARGRGRRALLRRHVQLTCRH